MATIKAFSDLDQSKKLAEILSIESADMFYDGVQDLYKDKVYNIPMNGSSITVRTGHIITEKGIKANLLLPAWSLTALLDVLPDNCGISKENGKYAASYVTPNDGGTYTNDNPVDACVAVIERLYELNSL